MHAYTHTYMHKCMHTHMYACTNARMHEQCACTLVTELVKAATFILISSADKNKRQLIVLKGVLLQPCNAVILHDILW